MGRNLWKVAGLAGIGLVYGLVLAMLGFLAAGFGHGTYVPIGLSSSPLSYVQSIHLAFFGIPALWCLVGLLLAGLSRRVPRAMLLAVLLAHYAALPIVLSEGSAFGDWAYARKVSQVMALAVAVYGLGQLSFWIFFAQQVRRLTRPARLGARDLLLTATFFLGFFVLPALAIQAYFRSLQDKEYAFPIEEPAHHWTVQAVKPHAIQDVPPYDERGGFDYTDKTWVIASERVFHWLRLRKPGGELYTGGPQAGRLRCEAVPEPQGFQPDNDIFSSFGDPVLWTAPGGGQFLRWNIGGNGDHGLALRRGGTGPFTTARSKLVLSNSNAVCNSEGAWYLVVWEGNLPQGFQVSVHTVDERLHLSLLGEHRSVGHHDVGVLDAAFVGSTRLHLVWGDVEPGINARLGINRLRLRAIDFDVQGKVWSGERELWRLDRFISSVSPRLHVPEDGSIHYLWAVDTGKNEAAGGIFYQAGDGGETLKLAESHRGFKSLTVDKRIVVCFTRDGEPQKVYFRVIDARKPGPVTSITLQRRADHTRDAEYIVLGGATNQTFWLVDTLDVKTAYRMEVKKTESDPRP